MWNTHSSLSGPHRSGPIGTSTLNAPPNCGWTIQRIRTSSSRCARDRSAVMCTLTERITSRRPSMCTPSIRPIAAPAVRGDDVVGRDRVGRAVVARADGRHGALAVLLDPDHLVPEPDPAGVELLRAGLEDRLEPDLRQVGLPARTRGDPGGIGRASVPRLQFRDPPAGRLVARDAEVPPGGAHVVRRGTPLVDRCRRHRRRRRPPWPAAGARGPSASPRSSGGG